MKDLNTLKYLLTEDIYLIPETNRTTTTASPITEPKAPQETSPPLDIKETAEVSASDFNFKGNKNGSVIVLVNDRNNEALNKEQEELLLKILKAVGISKENMLLVNTAFTKVDNIILQSLSATKILQFYPDYDLAESPTALYSTVIDNGKTRLISDPLNDLIYDLSKKKMLWNALQKMFIE
ncbi:hypothetical protein FNH22_27050 [Fulvivirga sp. M361]|uniref:hypothetical protein n=1 Tax=Fulvivirga sp. M361 TaxID=2594266 RepID=UPI00117A533A|nr:hypothetical protein [Fulvivirga sp. M361]TRX49477.1 hypothetical protein FNH22_27050 [Fulvivirga sp. M361]